MVVETDGLLGLIKRRQSACAYGLDGMGFVIAEGRPSPPNISSITY